MGLEKCSLNCLQLLYKSAIMVSVFRKPASKEHDR